MKAIIMAGGKGTRLRPLTRNVPKPMLPLLDKPVMEYSIELLKRHGITEIAITLQHLPEVIRRYFGDGSSWGVNLRYFEEEVPLGTAGGVRNAQSFLDETFLVLSGDVVADFDLKAALEYHKARQSVCTIIMTSAEIPVDFGIVMTDTAGKVIRFLEKPEWSEVFSNKVNAGIYIVEPKIFHCFAAGNQFDFSKDLFPLLLLLGMPLFGYCAEGYWSDIGSIAQYRKTQAELLKRRVSASIDG